MSGLAGLWARRRSRDDERGVAAVVVAVFISACLFALAAVTVDVARLQLEGQRLQKAADAAATAGVTWMPQDLPQATTTARRVSALNGYPHSGDTTVTAQTAARPGQLQVTVTSKVPNLFGRFFGIDDATLTRHAIADYVGPQPMGSPCNTMGNEPDSDTTAANGGSKLVAPAGANCPRKPDFWANLNGPQITKTQGDQYHVRKCAGGETGCGGSNRNQDFDLPADGRQGYFYLIRVGEAAVNQPITIEIYDPAFVNTGNRCESAPTGTFPTNNNDDNPNAWNPYTTVRGLERYAKSVNSFCSGDGFLDYGNNVSSAKVTTTSFGLRNPAATNHPLDGTPNPTLGCTRQYPGYRSVSVNELLQYKLSKTNTKQNNPDYDDHLARVFHQWVKLCTFTPTQIGDYYLQVRTNVKMDGSVNHEGSYRPSNNASHPIFTQVGDDPSVEGHGGNRFSLRAYGASNTISGAVSVASWGRMPINANADTATSEFNLIRVLPGAAGKKLLFQFFDAGDAASNGTMTVLRPADARGDAISDCRGTGAVKTGALSNCSITGIRSSTGYNGKLQGIEVQIPANYTCNYESPGGCWFKVRVGFGSGEVTDTTTWTAEIVGNPVRLIE